MTPDAFSPATLPDDFPCAVLVAELAPPPPARTGGALARAARGIGVVWECCFGAAVLLLCLAVLAAVPVLQFLTLGYLLEVSGRVARSGRLRDGFFGARRAARAGSILLGAGLCLLPLRVVSSLWVSAELIDPAGPVARGWKTALSLLTLLVAAHIALACARGGRLRHFLLPLGTPLWLVRRLRRGGYLREARDGVWDFTRSLRLPYYFWLGLRGFAGGFLWLAAPVTLLALGRVFAPLGFLGWLLLVGVLLYLPFLQAHFAASGRFRALFEVRAIRDGYRRAPVAFAWSFLVALTLALPLYLLKIEMVPREAAWLPGLVFVVFIFPARLLAGWGLGRAGRRSAPRHWLGRWSGRPVMLAAAAAYGVIIYFTQFVAWGGLWSLYEQHAFLLPVPFVSM